MAMILDLDSKADLGFPYWTPVRRSFRPESPFFDNGNIERELLAKQVALDLTEDERHNMVEEDGRQGGVLPHCWMWCSLKSLEEFEEHYNTRHSASCSVCSRVYPTSRLLSIHLSEAHDSFFQAKVARGYPMYECLVEGCVLKFNNYKSRQQHLVDKHKFPSAFEFLKKAQPSKKARQKQQHRKHYFHKRDDEAASSKMELEDENIDSLVSGVSRLSTTRDSSVSSISFGRRHTRGVTFVPRAVQRETSTPSGTK